jgi:hypothetical protein
VQRTQIKDGFDPLNMFKKNMRKKEKIYKKEEKVKKRKKKMMISRIIK